MKAMRIALGMICLGAGVVHANPRALPFTYTTDTLPVGQVEIEQFEDIVPVAALQNGNPVAILDSQVQTEIEIGIAERLELGLYFTFSSASFADQSQNVPLMPEGNGLKQRLRYILADPGSWPIDVGFYGEVTENEHELEFEGKVLLQRRFNKLRIAANLTTEYEFYFAADPITNAHQRDIVIDPSAGATYEVSPKFHIGIDSWMRGEYPQNPSPVGKRPFSLGPEVYVGPALMFNFGKLWWSFGAYGRVTDTSHGLAQMEADAKPSVGLYNEVYGPVWFRSMIGYNL